MSWSCYWSLPFWLSHQYPIYIPLLPHSYDLYNVPEIMNAAKLERLKWLGHLTRANMVSPCRKLTFSNLESKKSVGIPNLRWMDNVEKGLRIFDVQR
jgi:hypothetical protein